MSETARTLAVVERFAIRRRYVHPGEEYDHFVSLLRPQ